MLLYKSVKQRFSPDAEIIGLMKTFQLMVNDCIRLGFAFSAKFYGLRSQKFREVTGW